MSHRWKHARFLVQDEENSHLGARMRRKTIMPRWQLIQACYQIITVPRHLFHHHHHHHHHHHKYPRDSKQELSRSKHMYNIRYNDTQANTSTLWILGGKQIVCMEFMQLVGYSNNLQKTRNRMQYYRDRKSVV